MPAPRRRGPAVIMLAIALAAVGVGIALVRSPAAIRVAPGDSLQDAVSSAPAGALIRLEPGEHRGPLTITKPLTIAGPRDAVVAAPPDALATVTIRAHRVVLDGFQVAGGETGVHVREAENVGLTGLIVTGSQMQGVDVADAHATIRGVTVRDLKSPRAQGIEIRNSEHRGTISVSDSVVKGGQEGLVSHVSRVRFENNVVTGTTMHAISITEMSRGSAGDNIVARAAGAGLYCGDMSLCDFRGNEVASVRPSNDTRSGAGWGLLVHYHSSAHSEGDVLDGAAGPVGVFGASHLRDRSALRFGEGWRGLAPGLWIIPVALLALVGTGHAARRLTRPREQDSRGALRWIEPVALVGVAVQTFHMIEHGLQVYRVHFDGVPSRGGIVGPVVEAEWIHFTYNVLVLVTLALVASGRAHSWGGRAPSRADAFLSGALLLQGYHVVEHALKVVQHVSTGAKVNPGIAGRWVDLVWFHFGINLAVYVGFATAMILLFPRLRVRGLEPHRSAATAVE